MQEATKQSSFLEKVRRVTQSCFPYINKTARAIFAAALTAMTAREAEGGTIKGHPKYLKLEGVREATIPMYMKPGSKGLRLNQKKVDEIIADLHLEKNWEQKSKAIKNYTVELGKGPFIKTEDKGHNGDLSVYTYVSSWDPNDYYIFHSYDNLIKILGADKKGGVYDWHPDGKTFSYEEQLLGLQDVFTIAMRDAVLSSGSVEAACKKGYEPWALIVAGACLLFLGNCIVRSIHGGRNDSTLVSTAKFAAGVGSVIVGCMCLTTGGPGPLGSPSNVEATLKKAFKEAEYWQDMGSPLYIMERMRIPPYNPQYQPSTPERLADFQSWKKISKARQKTSYLHPRYRNKVVQNNKMQETKKVSSKIIPMP